MFIKTKHLRQLDLKKLFIPCHRHTATLYYPNTLIPFIYALQLRTFETVCTWDRTILNWANFAREGGNFTKGGGPLHQGLGGPLHQGLGGPLHQRFGDHFTRGWGYNIARGCGVHYTRALGLTSPGAREVHLASTLLATSGHSATMSIHIFMIFYYKSCIVSGTIRCN